MHCSTVIKVARSIFSKLGVGGAQVFYEYTDTVYVMPSPKRTEHRSCKFKDDLASGTPKEACHMGLWRQPRLTWYLSLLEMTF